MIDARIRVETPAAAFTTTFEVDGVAGPAVDHDAWNDAQQAELLAAARTLGKDVVRVEVEYPSEFGGGWEVSGDAVEIDFRSDPPTVVTLPPYAEVAP